jgi:hypothetical protein
MAKVLSKYVNLPDISQQDVVYQSQKDYVEALSYNAKLKPKGDLEKPYSFREWYNTRYNILPGQEYTLYNKYLSQWYEDRKQSGISTNIDTQDAYVQILTQIRALIDVNLPDIDVNDPTTIVDNISIYSQKIKDITQYFIAKKESLRKAKLKYNMVGTNIGLERVFYEYLLKAFTKNEISKVLLTDLPELSASNNLTITIEELYDDSSYFDRDPAIPVSAYFPYTQTSKEYLSGYGINDEDTFNWLYSTGVSQLCADNPLLWVVDEVIAQYENGIIPLSAIEDTTTKILNDYNRINLTKKYLGENQYIISGGYYMMPSSMITMDLLSGNNWFYWPYGHTELTVNSQEFKDIALIDTTLIESGATPASSYEMSDVIYVYHNNEVKGAWLQSPAIGIKTYTMSAELLSGTSTEFIYPFPGYGIMADDIEWTGRQYDNLDRTFYFLEKRLQKQILQKYWSDKLTNNTIISSINIQYTNLVNCGANAGKSTTDSDVIIIRPKFDQDGLFHDNTLSAAWLYNVEDTYIQIDNGDNYILWPHEKYQNTPIFNPDKFTNAASAVNISDLKFYMLTGNSLSEADVVYKINSEGNILTAAWLSADTFFDENGNITNFDISAGDLIKYNRKGESFILNIPLHDAKPIWCTALVNRVSGNLEKGYDIWGGNNRSDYKLSNILITPDLHIEYINNGPSTFIWTENIAVETYNYDSPAWKKLNIEIIDDPQSPQLSVTAINEPSDIIFKTDRDNPQRINYFAVNPFKWNQVVIDSTLGYPPTGGVWVPILSGELIQVIEPYTHLTNRHFPTQAYTPYIDGIYSSTESGGYFIPKNLGVSTALTRNNNNVFETINQKNPNVKIFQNINTYNEDIGLTNTFQYTPVSTINVDSQWMKSQITEGERSNIIDNPNIYQEFIPYQASYENYKHNKFGILQRGDGTEQYEQVLNDLHNALLKHWDIDIFGVQYGLYNKPEATTTTTTTTLEPVITTTTTTSTTTEEPTTTTTTSTTTEEPTTTTTTSTTTEEPTTTTTTSTTTEEPTTTTTTSTTTEEPTTTTTTTTSTTTTSTTTEEPTTTTTTSTTTEEPTTTTTTTTTTEEPTTTTTTEDPNDQDVKDKSKNDMPWNKNDGDEDEDED